MKVKIISKSKHSLPEYSTLNSAGMDIRANLDKDIVMGPLDRVLVPTGLYMQLPEGHEAQIRPRSGLALQTGLTLMNSPGTIDSDYRGEVGIILVNLSNNSFTIKDGERICQMIIAKHETIKWIPVEDLAESDRSWISF